MKKLSFSNASMMYRLHHKLALLLFSLVVTSSQAQIYTIKVEPSEIDELLALKSAIQIPTFEMKGLNDAEIAHIKAEDEKNISLGKPPRVAVPIQARINTAEHGIWTESRGKKLWLLEIEAKNASMIAPIFRQLNLEADAQIFMFTNDRQFLMGPITSENIPQNLETVSPDFLPSESITIAYFTEKESNLEVSGVNFVYNKSLAKVGFGAAFPCHIDVTDPLADAFKFEQNAVAVLLTNDDHGSAVCTATVVNNTNEDFRPLLLTANHCFDITVIPSTLRIRFRWQQGMISSTVSGVFINRRTFQGHITFVGANIKAQSEKKADFALIEMFNRISPSHNISFLGWDKVSTPQTSTILHHPQGDFMKITRDAQPAIHTAVTNGFFANNGWELTFRQQNDFGFTEPGSSGSALLNEGHLISGQLSHSVPANCARIPSTAGFGRLGVSFVGNNTTSSRVGDYLAPSSSANTQTAAFQLDGNSFITCRDVSQTISAPNLKTANGILYDYTWTASSNLIITGTGNQVQVSARASMPAQTTEFIRCEIRTPRHLGSLLVGRSNQHLLTWKPTIKVMYNGYETSTATFVGLNRSHTFRAIIEGTTPNTIFTWAISGANNSVSIFRGQDFLDVNFRSSIGITVTLTAQTGSCVQTRTFAIIGSGFKKQQESAILNSDAVQIYPNPATSNQVLIELPKNLIVDAPLSIKVRDVDGKIVSELTSIEPTIALNIQNISNGIYTISVQSNDNIVTKKLIIQH